MVLFVKYVSDTEAELHYSHRPPVTITAPNVRQFLLWWLAPSILTPLEIERAARAESEETCITTLQSVSQKAS